jgi:hypothetical protein
VAAAMVVIGSLCWLVVHPERALDTEETEIEQKFVLASKDRKAMPSR